MAGPATTHGRIGYSKLCASFLSLLACLPFAIPATAAAQESEDQIDFSTQVLPILSNHCFACHGPDAEQRQGDLRLDLEDDAKNSAIIPGDVDNSLMLERILSDDPDLKMPPAESHRDLTDDQIQILKQWVKQGAPWSRHWAFVPPVARPVPTFSTDASQTDWPRSPIDSFVLHTMRRNHLSPNSAASREQWLRRVSFDLTGLPPTLQELDQFLADPSADAFEKQVDRLLASPHYGERMAADWLDLARFADTNGYQNDFNRSMWPWRDWVIQAFNSNMPADQFILQQIAGDMLPEPSQQQLIATGFNRNHRMVTEGGSIDEEWRVENVVDRVETTATSMLGLTMGCARCHDHKYDPIHRQDFYQFYAFFNNVDEKGVYNETRGNVPPLISVPTPQQIASRDALKQQIEECDRSLAQSSVSPRRWDQIRSTTVNTNDHRWIVAGQTLVAANSHSKDQVQSHGPLNWQDSPAGSALAFNGQLENHLEIHPTFQPESDQPFHWSLWASVDQAGALISKMDDADGYRGWDTILLEDLRVKVHLVNHWADNAIAVTSKIPVPKNQWFHLVVSYDGSRKAAGVAIFLDGKPLELNVEQDSLSGSIQTQQPLRLARRSASLPLKGSLAGVSLLPGAADQEQVQQRIDRDLAATSQQATSIDQLPAAVKAYLLAQSNSETQRKRQDLVQQREQLEKSFQTTMIMKDRSEYRPTYVLKRGQYDAPDTSQTLWPEIPEFLGQLPPDAPRNRLGLAQWLISPENPLVARVIVNRVWQRLFGTGIVPTSDNLGVQGDPPSHPELLDWLAVDFVQHGWDLKRLHRQIVLTSTYRQSNEQTASSVAKDPANRWLSRGPRRRQSAEMVRDHALAVSGLLTTTIGGPSVKPYQPEGLWDELAGGANGGPYQVADGPDLYRRSLYTFRKRTVSHPTLGTFDAPSWEICQAKRATTNTPLQALALLNDTTYVEAANHLAMRMQKENSDLQQQLVFGFRLTTSRFPTESELSTLSAGYQKYLQHFQSNPQDVASWLGQGKSPVPADQQSAQLAALATSASVILNLDASITR